MDTDLCLRKTHLATVRAVGTGWKSPLHPISCRHLQPALLRPFQLDNPDPQPIVTKQGRGSSG